ncbi:MAG: type IV toxin-antitoxin system AbiEi family antitoxin domain-containing protein [Atopobiaceae bacterium]|nr:type IV toxin-antitoxin system AbiEi family antitoxin domain-containing protein [Atopobiaceae bacterium]
MAIIDDIYANVDDFGLITSTEARELGVSNSELVQQERRGKLSRVARGVYRMPVWPYQEAAPYAIAVKATGGNAYLCEFTFNRRGLGDDCLEPAVAPGVGESVRERVSKPRRSRRRSCG